MFYGICNLRYGHTRACVYHTEAGVWGLQRWDNRRMCWNDMGFISPRLGMRLMLMSHQRRQAGDFLA